MSSTPDLRIILATPLDKPEQLFGRPESIPGIFRTLAKLSHPDAGGNPEIFEHLVALRAAADTKAAAGRWWDNVTFLDSGRRPLRWWNTGLASVFIEAIPGHQILQESIYASLAIPSPIKRIHSALAAIQKNPSPGTPEVLHVMGHALPTTLHSPRPDALTLICREQPSTPIRLADLLAFHGGTLPAPHVAWIISRLLDFCCLLEWAGLTHGSLLEESIFVEPTQHSIIVLGGWEFATRFGERLAPLQDPRVVAVMPRETLRTKTATQALDFALVRRLGFLMAGSPAGVPTSRTNLPPPLAEWLRKFCLLRVFARANLQSWRTALDAGFGGRRFVHFPTTFDMVYWKGY